jgi:peroxiredoxin
MAVESSKVNIGTAAADFNLPATDGKNYSLTSFKDNSALVVVFSCNHCPYAQAAWPLLVKLAAQFREKGIAFVAINPNDETLYPEDSFAVMKEKVGEWGINFSYLRDESQSTAKAYGAVCTPDIFVYDKDRKLFYHGRINDNWQVPEKVTSQDLSNALNDLVEGRPPPTDQKPSMGCSIKWKD